MYEALEIAGQQVSEFEMVEEVEKDRIFFEESGGGVTFSGGEPLMQPDFLAALLNEFKRRNIHTTLDTSGYAPFETLERIAEKVDLFLYDLKTVDDEKHKMYTGVSNRLILENLKKLSKKEKRIMVRIPLIGGVNDDDETMKDTAQFLIPLKNIKQINLLPYHRGGVEKYKRLREGNSPPAFHPPSDKGVKKIKKMFEAFGFSVEIGG